MAAATSLLVGPAAAHAQRPDPLGFSIDAVGFPSFFIYDAKPGETVRGRVRVRNIAGESRVAYLRTVDAKTAATGGVEYGSQSRPPRGTGRWIRLGARTLNLPAGAAVEVPFTARVPRDARRGDQLAGIVAFGKPPPPSRARGGRFRLRFVSRLAIAVQFRLPGKREPRLELRDAGVQVLPAGASLALRLANTGNTLIPKTSGRVTVSTAGKTLFSRPVRLDSFVPKTELVYALPWLGRPVEGDYEVTGEIRPAGAKPIEVDTKVRFGKERIREFRKETGRPAVEAQGTSPLLIAFLGAIIVALTVLAAAYLRLRRKVRVG